MSEWHDLAQWLYGEARDEHGFWYNHPLWEVRDLTEDELYWVPDATSLCMLWHVGHVAHRERLHLGRFVQALDGELIPPRYEVFGTEWRTPAEVRASVDSVAGVFRWVESVRQASLACIQALTADDWHRVPPTSEYGLTVAHWVFLTVSHTTLHLGRVQMLRAMLLGRRDRAC
ncbi:MAG: DinB family protein [Chloroflexota bacterium]